ncbi:MAG: TonB-dependent receptor, partial [Flavobacteriaceae bacterium]|nr:TonB-dependent receptor [Flavobacteriaceae bacterium]
AYVTDWDNRTILSGGLRDPNGIPDDGDEINVNIFERGVRQYHSGAELDFRWRVQNWLTLQGYVSGGSWVYRGSSSFTVYNDDTNQIIEEGEGQNRSGIKISTAPQFTSGLGVNARIWQGFTVDGNINYQANHYRFTDTRTTENPGRLQPYSLTDLGATYEFDLGSNELVFRANVFNVFDEIRIQQMDRFGFINTNGRTYNASVKYKF